MKAVYVESSARLHLGFYNFYEDGVAYGSLGVAVEEPQIVVVAEPSERVELVNRADVDVSNIVFDVVDRLGVRGVKITVEKAIPRHVGLGSTTQTSLAVAFAVARLYGLNYGVRELALILGRGRDSGIGVATFEFGGFVVDSGRIIGGKGVVDPPRSVDDIPLPVIRKKLPRDWYFLVFIPKKRRGLNESEERRAMDRPAKLPKDLQYELYKLVLLHIIPSIERGDVDTFGRAITKLQLIVGEYFSKYQGGVFCCEETETIVKSLIDSGAAGAGQSSWGPTAYGIVKGLKKAKAVLNRVLQDIHRKGFEVSYFITRARNRGARVKLLES